MHRLCTLLGPPIHMSYYIIPLYLLYYRLLHIHEGFWGLGVYYKYNCLFAFTGGRPRTVRRFSDRLKRAAPAIKNHRWIARLKTRSARVPGGPAPSGKASKSGKQEL